MKVPAMMTAVATAASGGYFTVTEQSAATAYFRSLPTVVVNVDGEESSVTSNSHIRECLPTWLAQIDSALRRAVIGGRVDAYRSSVEFIVDSLHAASVLTGAVPKADDIEASVSFDEGVYLVNLLVPRGHVGFGLKPGKSESFWYYAVSARDKTSSGSGKLGSMDSFELLFALT